MEMVIEPDARPIVVVNDNDESVRSSLANLLQSVDMGVDAFSSPTEFLRKSIDNAANCIVLDVRLPAMSGLDLQRELAGANVDIPIIFVTGHADIPMTVQAMKAGAIDFLAKPAREQDLLDAVNLALARDRSRRQSEGPTSAPRASGAAAPAGFC